MPYNDVNGESHGDAYYKLVTRAVETAGWDFRFAVDSDGVLVVKEG